MGKEVFCWSRFNRKIKKLEILQQQRINGALEQLANGEKKVFALEGEDNAYKLEVGYECRILFTENPTNRSQLIAVVVTTDHNYQKALKTLRSFKKNHQNHTTNAVKINTSEPNKTDNFKFNDTQS